MKRQKSFSVMCVWLVGLLLLGCGDVVVDADKKDTSSDRVEQGTASSAGTDRSTDSAAGEELMAPQGIWDNVVALTGCGCHDATEACNDDGTCVPRCDDEGRCLHAVFNEMALPIHTQGDDVFVQLFDCSETEPAYVFNCPGADVWRVSLSSSNKSVTTTACSEDDDRGCVLGVLSNNATVVSDSSAAFRLVYPDGSTEIVQKPEEIQGHENILAGDVVYAAHDGGVGRENSEELTLWEYSLGSERKLAAVLDGSELLDAVTIQMGSSFGQSGLLNISPVGAEGVHITFSIGTEAESAHCIFDMSAGASSVVCIPAGAFVGPVTNINTGEIVGGNLLFVGHTATRDIISDTLYALAASGAQQSLYTWPRDLEFEVPDLWDEPGVEGLWLNGVVPLHSHAGWIYMFDAADENIIRMPFTAPQSSEVVYPLNIAPPEAFGVKQGSAWQLGLQLGDDAIVWHQTVQDADFNVLRTLIVSAPLPPRPCSAELLCTGEGETCGADGFCVKTDVADDTEPDSEYDTWDDVVALTGCGCNDTTEACNDDGTCVPRCDEKGRCLHAVFDGMATVNQVDGRDALVKTFELFESGDNRGYGVNGVQRVNMDSDHSSVAMTSCSILDGRGCVLGVMSNNATVASNAHAEFTLYYPDGSTEVVAKPEEIQGHENILVGDDVYAAYFQGTDRDNPDKLTLWRYSLGGDREVEAVLAGSELLDAVVEQIGSSFGLNETIAIETRSVTGNYVTFFIFTEPERAHCIFDQSIGASSMACIPIWTDDPTLLNISTGEIVDGKLLFIERTDSAYILKTLDTAGAQQTLYTWQRDQEFVIPELWNEPGARAMYFWSESSPVVYSFAGWIYFYDAASENLVRMSLAAPQSPEVVYPITIAPPEAFGVKAGSLAGDLPALGADALVWRQAVQDADFNLLRTLIVSAPLPPRPCSATLLCTGEGETCSAEGFCVTN